jgi:hypothetical protein
MLKSYEKKSVGSELVFEVEDRLDLHLFKYVTTTQSRVCACECARS